MANINNIKNTDRASEIRRNDNIKDLHVNLYDVDTIIKYYFDNVIQPKVMDGNEQINVPVVYGSPERWKSIQKSGVYRDKKGKVQYPAIVYKRTNVEKVNTLGTKVDVNNPLFTSFQKRHTKSNRYDNFAILTNRQPTKQFHNVVIPDYVKLSYSCIIYTEYLEQLNKIVEDINYAGGQYWGKEESFKFLSKIDSFDIESVAEQGQDRVSKSTFTLSINGFVIPDSIQKAMSNYSPKTFSQVKINVESETVRTMSEVETLISQNSIIKPK
tara:strand:+ start:128 stop:937 length:810 start_codon:yes stop_codon:yes gene_type:complete